MKRFYILYKDGITVEGTVSLSEEDFKKRFILPIVNDVYSWRVWESLEVPKLTSELISEIVI